MSSTETMQLNDYNSLLRSITEKNNEIRELNDNAVVLQTEYI
jgi:hypothetical protein